MVVLSQSTTIFPKGTYLLYDDDCGICTKFSRLLGKVLRGRTKVLPMHLDYVEEEGMKEIPGDYWKSFHVVQNGEWYTEGQAILELASIFPGGNLIRSIASFPPIYRFLVYFLRQMQRKRKSECSIDFS